MKKTILAIIAVCMVWATSANYTGDVSQYYNQNKSNRTFDVKELWPVIYTSYPITGLKQEKVLCNKVRKMCYVSSDVLRVFKLDVNAFQAWQEKVTGKKVVFRDLWNVIK